MEKWIGLANQVLRPDFLQQHPNRYLNIHKSKERIKVILQGGRPEEEQNQNPAEEISVGHNSCYEGYTSKYPIREKGCDTDGKH